jgi:hypothetical protein
MVGSADNHDINILIVNKIPPILIEMLDLFTLQFLRVGGTALKHILVNVAECYAINFRIAQECLQIGETLTAASNQTQMNLVIGANRFG